MYSRENTYTDTTIRKGAITSNTVRTIPQDIKSRWGYFPDSCELKLRFFVPSAGGGESKLVVSIGESDLLRMLDNICSENPSFKEKIAGQIVRAGE